MAIFAFVIIEAVGDLSEGFQPIKGFTISGFLLSPEWRPDRAEDPKYGILALLAGTGAVTVVSMTLAVPLGLGRRGLRLGILPRSAERNAEDRDRTVGRDPVGRVGVRRRGRSWAADHPVDQALNPYLPFIQPAYVGVNVLNASIILALMSVPIIVSVGEDSLKAVPDSYREAALSLGASRWEIVYRVLFPAAKNGLLAAVLLGVGRAIGETMAVLLVPGMPCSIPHS